MGAAAIAAVGINVPRRGRVHCWMTRARKASGGAVRDTRRYQGLSLENQTGRFDPLLIWRSLIDESLLISEFWFADSQSINNHQSSTNHHHGSWNHQWHLLLAYI